MEPDINDLYSWTKRMFAQAVNEAVLRNLDQINEGIKEEKKQKRREARERRKEAAAAG